MTARARSRGLKLGLGTLAGGYLLILLVLPLAVVVQDALQLGPLGVWAAVTRPVALHALGLTVWTAAVAALITGVAGTCTAYVLVRAPVPGRAALNALIDLPLAVPTLVTGVMLVVLYGPQQGVGAWLAQMGWPVIFAPPGIVLALLFVTFPFVVRLVEPVWLGLDMAQEDAAATLGASAWTTWWRVIWPALAWPVTSGVLLAFARALGEFGAIVIVAGNIPFYSQTAAVYVFGEVESENRQGASAVSLVLVLLALAIVLVVERVRRRGMGGVR